MLLRFVVLGCFIMWNKVYLIECKIFFGIFMVYNFIRFLEWCVFVLFLILFYDGICKGVVDVEFNMNN